MCSLFNIVMNMTPVWPSARKHLEEPFALDGCRPEESDLQRIVIRRKPVLSAVAVGVGAALDELARPSGELRVGQGDCRGAPPPAAEAVGEGQRAYGVGEPVTSVKRTAFATTLRVPDRSPVTSVRRIR